MKDSILMSAIRGRVGSGILAFVAFLSVSFGLSPDDQATAQDMTNQVFTWVGSGSALLSGVLAFFSKFREAK